MHLICKNTYEVQCFLQYSVDRTTFSAQDPLFYSSYKNLKFCINIHNLIIIFRTVHTKILALDARVIKKQIFPPESSIFSSF